MTSTGPAVVVIVTSSFGIAISYVPSLSIANEVSPNITVFNSCEPSVDVKATVNVTISPGWKLVLSPLKVIVVPAPALVSTL